MSAVVDAIIPSSFQNDVSCQEWVAFVSCHSVQECVFRDTRSIFQSRSMLYPCKCCDNIPTRSNCNSQRFANHALNLRC